MVWVSHVMLFLSALTYTFSFGLIKEAAANLGQLHHLDPFLKEAGITDVEKVYEALNACKDPVVKRLAFWALSLQVRGATFAEDLTLSIPPPQLHLPAAHVGSLPDGSRRHPLATATQPSGRQARRGLCGVSPLAVRQANASNCVAVWRAGPLPLDLRRGLCNSSCALLLMLSRVLSECYTGHRCGEGTAAAQAVTTLDCSACRQIGTRGPPSQ